MKTIAKIRRRGHRNGRWADPEGALKVLKEAFAYKRRHGTQFKCLTRDEIIVRIKKTREDLLKEKAMNMRIPKSKIPARNGRHVDSAGAKAVMAEIWHEIKERGWRIRGMSDREIMARARAARYKIFEADVAARS